MGGGGAVARVDPSSLALNGYWPRGGVRVYLDGAAVGSVAPGAIVLTSTPIIGSNVSGTDARIGMVGMGPVALSAPTVAGVYEWLLSTGGLVD